MLTAHALPLPLAQGRFDLRSASAPLNPTEVRLKVSQLVTQNRINEANELSKQSLQSYPHNEELLVTRALLCETLQQWQEAADCLHRLLRVQGREAPGETWYQYVRVLRCQGLTNEALAVSGSALGWHPEHPGLLQERLSLLEECKLINFESLR